MSSQTPQAVLLERWDRCADWPEDTEDVAALAELVEVFEWCELIDSSEARHWRDRVTRLQTGSDAAYPWPAATRERARALLDDLFPAPERPVERPWEVASNGAETIAAALRRLGLISGREEDDYHRRLWPSVQTPGGPAIDGGQPHLPESSSRRLITSPDWSCRARCSFLIRSRCSFTVGRCEQRAKAICSIPPRVSQTLVESTTGHQAWVEAGDPMMRPTSCTQAQYSPCQHPRPSIGWTAISARTGCASQPEAPRDGSVPALMLHAEDGVFDDRAPAFQRRAVQRALHDPAPML